MGSITLRVSELLALAKQLSSDGMEYVDFLPSEADDEMPPCLLPRAGKKGDPEFPDYDEIELVPPSEFEF